jgi:hypothetical protein
MVDLMVGRFSTIVVLFMNGFVFTIYILFIVGFFVSFMGCSGLEKAVVCYVCGIFNRYLCGRPICVSTTDCLARIGYYMCCYFTVSFTWIVFALANDSFHSCTVIVDGNYVPCFVGSFPRA